MRDLQPDGVLPSQHHGSRKRDLQGVRQQRGQPARPAAHWQRTVKRSSVVCSGRRAHRSGGLFMIWRQLSGKPFGSPSAGLGFCSATGLRLILATGPGAGAIVQWTRRNRTTEDSPYSRLHARLIVNHHGMVETYAVGFFNTCTGLRISGRPN